MALLKLPTILLTFADARDDLPGLQKESSALHEVLLPLEQNGLANIEREESATLVEVFKRIVDYKNDMIVFHYAGHAGRDVLFMEENKVAAENIAGLLGQAPYLQLVFLNGCETREQVQLFLDNGVKAVIATYDPISDKLAAEFAKGFYYALSNDYTLGEAFEAAVRYVEKQEDQKAASRGFKTGSGVKRKRWAVFVGSGEEEQINWKISYRDKARLNLLLGSKEMIRKLMRGTMGHHRELISALLEGRTLQDEIKKQREGIKKLLAMWNEQPPFQEEEAQAAPRSRLNVLSEWLNTFNRLHSALEKYGEQSHGALFAEAYRKQRSVSFLEERPPALNKQKETAAFRIVASFIEDKFRESQYVKVNLPEQVAAIIEENTRDLRATKAIRKIMETFLEEITSGASFSARSKEWRDDSGQISALVRRQFRELQVLAAKLEQLLSYLQQRRSSSAATGPLSLKVAVESLWRWTSPHVRLTGAPGAGKTSSIIQLWATLLRQSEEERFVPIPVFVNLSDYQGAEEQDFIKRYIAKHYLELGGSEQQKAKKAIEEILDQPLKKGREQAWVPSVMLFLDGEIKPVDDHTLQDEIVALKNKKGLQIIHCCGFSRDQIPEEDALTSIPTELEICPMTTEEIKLKIGAERLQSFRCEIREMVRNRKWLARLFEFYHMIDDDRFDFKKKFLTEGELLWNYFEARLSQVIDEGESVQVYTRRFYLRHFIPTVLFRMYEQGKREIREDRLHELIHEISVELYQRSFLKVFPEYRRYFKYFLLKTNDWVEAEERFAIITRMCEDYGILIPISRYYCCTNQEVFDFFAAVHLHNEIVQSIWKAKYDRDPWRDELELPSGLWARPLPAQMLRFLGQVEGLHHSYTDLPVVKLLEKCRRVISRPYGQQVGSAVYNLLTAWKETKGYYPQDLSHLDLRNIDLSQLSQPLEEQPYYLPCDLEGALIRREDVFEKSKRQLFVSCLDYSSDGSTLICGLSDGTIRLWDTELHLCYKIIEAHPGEGVRAVCSVDIKGEPNIVSASANEVRIWDQQKAKLPVLAFGTADEALAFPDPLLSLTCWTRSESKTDYLYVAAGGGGEANALPVWKMDLDKILAKENIELYKMYQLHEDDVKSLAVSPDRTRLASGSWDNRVRVLDIEKKRENKSLTERHVSRINGVVFSEDGRYIASASNDDTIIVWDWQGGDHYRRLSGHYRDVNSVQFKKMDGQQYLISGGDDGQLILWNLEEIWRHKGPLVKDDVLNVSRVNLNTEVNCLRFSPDGKSVAAGNQSGMTHLFNLDEGVLQEGVQLDNTHFLLVHGCRFTGLHAESDLLKSREDKQLLRQYGAVIPEHEGDERDEERWRKMICMLSGEILRKFSKSLI